MDLVISIVVASILAKTHTAAAKLACADCHPTPAKFGEPMGFPAAARCMACHVLIANDKPAIAKLAELAKSNQPCPGCGFTTYPISYSSITVFISSTKRSAKTATERWASATSW
jgi:hypothetical protein